MVNCKVLSGPRPRVIAHRGASGLAPENTMAAFDLAVQAKADIIEIDVPDPTADGEVIVCHDEAVDRLTDGTGLISELRYGQLQQLDAGYRFDPDGTGQFPYRGKGLRLPRLTDVLTAYPHMPFYLEIKGKSPGLAERVSNVLRDFGRDDGSVLISSFSDRTLRRMRRLAPHVPTGSTRTETWRLLLRAKLGLPAILRSAGVAFQMPIRKFGLNCTTPRVVALCHRLGVEIHTYTVDDESEMRRLLAMGVDGLFTNQPKRLRAVVDSLNP